LINVYITCFDFWHYFSRISDINERLKELEPGILAFKQSKNRRGGTNISSNMASIREKALNAALLATHAKMAAHAGHQRTESMLLCAKRLEEFQHLFEGKDIVAERAAAEDFMDMLSASVASASVPMKLMSKIAPNLPMSREKDTNKPTTASSSALDKLVRFVDP
jgi:hypothetical protein